MSKSSDIGRDFNRLCFAMSIHSKEPIHRELIAILYNCLPSENSDDSKEYKSVALENLQIMQQQDAVLQNMLRKVLQDSQFSELHSLVQTIVSPPKM